MPQRLRDSKLFSEGGERGLELEQGAYPEAAVVRIPTERRSFLSLRPAVRAGTSTGSLPSPRGSLYSLQVGPSSGHRQSAVLSSELSRSRADREGAGRSAATVLTVRQARRAVSAHERGATEGAGVLEA